MSHTLHRDAETRSTADLKKVGAEKYARDPTTDVWCYRYAVDDGPIDLWTPGMPVPEVFVRAAADTEWEVAAFNDAFETAIETHIMAPRYGWPLVPIERHRCVMAEALAMGIPGPLNDVAHRIGLDSGKDMAGRDLMLRMAKPRRPRKGENPLGIFWFDDEERKQRLYSYCGTDVSAERDVEKRTLRLRPFEQRLWALDAKINSRGVFVDEALCNAAQQVASAATKWLNDEMRELTSGKVGGITQVADLAEWCDAQGYPMIALDKERIDEALDSTLREAPPHVRRALEIRREGAKASVSKIKALLNGRDTDGRARGLQQYHAASTGRWGGRRFQPHNLKRPELADIDSAIDALLTGDAEYVRLLYGEPLSVVGDCLRGMVRAEPGNKIVAADWSNIEGRMNGWLAGEDRKLQAFRDFDAGIAPDIYLVTAADIYGVPVHTLNKKSPERQPGKVCELAFGFQGGIGAWRRFEAAAPDMPKFSDEEVDGFKNRWREAHPNIQQFWYDLEWAAKRAIETPGKAFEAGRIAFKKSGSFLFMRRPCGSTIVYPYACIKDKMTPWGQLRPQVCYQGLDTYTRKWGDQFAHGGLLCNNAVQGSARDILAEAMFRLEARGYPVVLSVHDECVSEVAEDYGSADEYSEIMGEVPAWAEGLPLACEAWAGCRYRK